MVVGQHGNASVPTACKGDIPLTLLHQIQLRRYYDFHVALTGNLHN